MTEMQRISFVHDIVFSLVCFVGPCFQVIFIAFSFCLLAVFQENSMMYAAIKE